MNEVVCCFSDCGLVWFVNKHTYSGVFTSLIAGKTTLLRALALHDIRGIPENCQILHVEQEVVGDDTPVIQVQPFVINIVV
jgi:hypothetical protein